MTKPRGGYRPNAGGVVKIIRLTDEQARTLRTLLLVRYGKANVDHAQSYVVGLINAEWQAYDEMIQEQAEELANGVSD